MDSSDSSKPGAPGDGAPPSAPGDSAGQSRPGGRRSRKIRDVIAMTQANAFDGLIIQNMPGAEFEELSALISSHFGIKVGENKRTLVTGRVHPMLEKYGFATHRECLDAIKRDASGQLLSELANRISTNHTAFFREEAHFGLLRERILPDLAGRKREQVNPDLRIWCSACATGEEAYTILFTLLRFFGNEYSRWRAGVLATDISAAALSTARRGVYNALRVDPVPKDAVCRYFNRLGEDAYEVKPELRKEVTFRRLNLITGAYPFRQRFDIIFCRNVMIYFSRNVRSKLLSNLREWLEPGAYLFVGHSESLVGAHEGYEYVAPAVYRRSD
ncbi:MAG: protein-glutamate O-methyltransferase CheR [Planctomycetota bacterium]|jgi:chemotaxis protein methyltransferase CheR|nr:protein-glutamate O-methyltransferase CheR [Planctomycetota bacterium]